MIVSAIGFAGSLIRNGVYANVTPAKWYEPYGDWAFLFGIVGVVGLLMSVYEIYFVDRKNKPKDDHPFKSSCMNLCYNML